MSAAAPAPSRGRRGRPRRVRLGRPCGRGRRTARARRAASARSWCSGRSRSPCRRGQRLTVSSACASVDVVDEDDVHLLRHGSTRFLVHGGFTQRTPDKESAQESTRGEFTPGAAAETESSRECPAPVSSITSRSTPMPIPPAGGMPYSIAFRKTSSSSIASGSPAGGQQRLLRPSRSRWTTGSLSSEYAGAELDAVDDQVPRLVEAGLRAVRLGQRLDGRRGSPSRMSGWISECSTSCS